MAKKAFKTEVSQLLKLIIHSLYSHKEIFLRELISNASDAIDKLKYLTMTDDDYKGIVLDPKITIKLDQDNGMITISDNGIGMNEDDLNVNLGTIANSGTKNFLANMTGDQVKDSNLIGQFGVGFYSAFMVASKIEVISKKAGSDEAFKWESDGEEKYSINASERDGFGTDIILYLNDEGKEFANKWQTESLIKKYSDHIAFPIFLEYEETKKEGEGENEVEVSETKCEQINSASAIWKRNKSSLKKKDYEEFYETISHDMDEPLFYIHTQAEGTLDYSTLFYIPKNAPSDMYYADYKPGVKLYVKRVFITDDDKELLPPYLRFVKGVIDTEDLPLNVSREILQQNRVMANIRSASVKKLLGEFSKLAKKNSEKFEDFIKEYNRPLKEGLYSDFVNKDKLLEIVRFKSSEVDGWISLESYKERIKDDQKSIYYITGGREEALKKSPLVKAFKKKGFEVLICDDEIDELVVPMIGQYKELTFKSINTAGATDEIKSAGEKKKEEDAQDVVKTIKKILGSNVSDVIAAANLGNVASCIVSDENAPSAYIQQMMKQMGQGAGMADFKPVLQINPSHKILKAFEEKKDMQKDIAFMLLDQAKLVDGLEIEDPNAFVKRINKVALAAMGE